MRRRGRDVAVGGAAAVVAFAAVPAVLVLLVGDPLPHRWDRAALLSSAGLFDLLAAAAWVAWVACAWPLMRSVVGHVRRRESSAPDGARLVERLAVRIAAAILALAPAAWAGTAAAAASPVAASPVAPAPFAVAPAVATPSPGTSGPAAAVPASAPRYTVVVGDSLWSIAERAYGDGADWTAIAAANLGHPMGDGRIFVDPSVILPGWVLVLPALDGGPPAGDPPAGDPPPAGPVGVRSTADVSRPHSAVPAGGTAPGGPAHTEDRPAGAIFLGAGATGRNGGGGRASSAPSSPGPAGSGTPFPALAALGFGTVMAGLVARRARQARRLRGLQRPEGTPTPQVSDRAAELATAIGDFDDLPLVDWIELADRHLSGALEAAGRAPDAPPVRLLRAGPDAVEAHLGAPVDWSPAGWEPAGPSTWRLPTGAPHDVARLQDPWLPVLLPLGDDDHGAWLVPVVPGECLSVLGPAAAAMVAAMRVGARSWSWSEQVVVTDDPVVAARAAGCHSGGGQEPGASRVLFVGDPDALEPDARSRVGVLTTEPNAAADLTVLADTRAVSVHPLGVTVRPHLLDEGRAAAVAELLAPAAASTTVSTAGAAPAASAHPDGSGPPARPHRVSPSFPPERAGFVPGTAEVRLLVAVPRIDGLRAELPANRARRAVELVAYLALHRPDPVTGDRLRTRVLGSEDADAAAKTLFNTAGAARRALGVDAGGGSLLPTATRTGHYRLSPAVTVDAARAATMAEAGCAADDTDLSMALLRGALDLVEAEPLSGLLTGYAWWRGEGHEHRVTDSLVDAACRLGRSAAAAGHVDLARWAVDRGRLVEPYSEALARVSMEVAAASGDAARLRREWLDCVQLVDEVDPGSLPSPATERLYAELRHRVASAPSRKGDERAVPVRAATGAGTGGE